MYKLEEIDRRVKLLRRGQRVLDLGAFPGSWTLYAAGKVGREGHVLGIDLQEHAGALPDNAEMRTADVSTVTAAELGTFDVVLSDMAPSTMGVRDVDQWRSYQLFIRALEIAEQVLVPGGTFVGKIFQGAEFLEAKRAVQRVFELARVIKPEASRKESYEIFLLGLGRRPITAAATEPTRS